MSKLTHSLLWTDSDDFSLTGWVDRFALDQAGNLLACSAVMHHRDAGAFRDALAQVPKFPLLITSPEARTNNWPSGKATCGEHGYSFATHKLPFDLVHALAVSKAPGFLVDDSDETLWRFLKSPRFTTPLLRSWLPWIKAYMLSTELLKPATNHNLHCHTALMDTFYLDEVVSRGLRTRKLRIQE
jgi:hypothetical protein